MAKKRKTVKAETESSVDRKNLNAYPVHELAIGYIATLSDCASPLAIAQQIVQRSIEIEELSDFISREVFETAVVQPAWTTVTATSKNRDS